MNNNPIGIFDSGLGGLSVWREVRTALPDESIIYFGDGKNCPYGPKPPDMIREYSLDITRRLVEAGAKLIVVACNTATAAAIFDLRKSFPGIPFVGMEPAVKPAALSTRSGVVAVLATEASFEGELYKNTSLKYGRDIEILAVPGTGFVEIVEMSAEAAPETESRVRFIVEPLLDSGADKIVLGCTHYPFLRRHIERVIADRDVEVIDPAPAVARQVEKLLDEHNLRASEGHRARYGFMTLGGDAYLERLKGRACSATAMNLG